MKGIDLNIDNLNNSLKGAMTCKEISVANIKVTDNLLQLYCHDNWVGAGYSFDNHAENETSGEFIVNGEVSGEEGNRP